jgi:hypothetical protein
VDDPPAREERLVIAEPHDAGARVPHPRDGRSSVVIATAHGHAEVRSRLGGMHERMLGAAREVPEGARREAAAFLRAMARVLDEESTQAAPLVVDEDPAPRGG